jgi:hypothetical protein
MESTLIIFTTMQYRTFTITGERSMPCAVPITTLLSSLGLESISPRPDLLQHIQASVNSTEHKSRLDCVPPVKNPFPVIFHVNLGPSSEEREHLNNDGPGGIWHGCKKN